MIHIQAHRLNYGTVFEGLSTVIVVIEVTCLGEVRVPSSSKTSRLGISFADFAVDGFQDVSGKDS